MVRGGGGVICLLLWHFLLLWREGVGGAGGAGREDAGGKGARGRGFVSGVVTGSVILVCC